MNEITPEEKKQFFFFWMTQRKAIEGRVSEQTMCQFDIYTEKDNVGYEFGQLRPGKLGQWDLYWTLAGEQGIGCDKNEALIASGLNAAEVAEEKRREHYREQCVNPDDQFEIANFERIQRMTPEQLDIEIASLESQLTVRIPA